MIYYINYANGPYNKTQGYAASRAKKLKCFDEIVQYGPEDIDSNFYKKNKKILDEKRGNGLWLWKPYFILKTLEVLQDGDYVFYCDSGSYMIRPIQSMLQTMDDDVWLSDIPFIEKQYTKPELFEIMECNNENYKESNQIQGGFVIVKKSERSMNFIREWLNLCCMPGVLSMNTEKKEKAEENGFIEHRSDQSVISLLAKKYNIVPHLDPTQFGRVPELYRFDNKVTFKIPEHSEKYKVCIVLHRSKDANAKIRIKRGFFAYAPMWLINLYINIWRNK